MNWYNLALGFVFLCNICFLVGAAFLLYKIVDSTEETRIQLMKAARENSNAGAQLLNAAHRSIREMERASEAQLARETSNQRAIVDLANQVHALVENLKRLLAKGTTIAAPGSGDAGAGGSVSAGTGGGAGADTPPNNADAIREKLRAELTAALARNHKLQDEVSQTVYQLKDVSQANQNLIQEIRDLKEVKKSYVDQLLQKAAELEAQLQAARDRAKAAELLAEDNAFKLANLREEAEKFEMSDGIDQSGLIESQQDQIDVLAAREKALLERMDKVEQMFSRSLTEKAFIEDRFLKLDLDSAAPTGVLPKPPDEISPG